MATVISRIIKLKLKTTSYLLLHTPQIISIYIYIYIYIYPNAILFSLALKSTKERKSKVVPSSSFLLYRFDSSPKQTTAASRRTRPVPSRPVPSRPVSTLSLSLSLSNIHHCHIKVRFSPASLIPLSSFGSCKIDIKQDPV